MEENALVEEREELMISSNGSESSNLRKAHFLKPTLDPKNQTLPNLPPLSLSSKLNINQVNFWVTFMGRPPPQKNWDIWVENLQKTHQATWKKVGIFDAIKASTYKICSDNELIIKLAERWCPVTNTFFFPWGESTITLEDMMILGELPVLGLSVKTPSESIELEENYNKLVSVVPEIRRRSKGGVTQREWMNYFMGTGGELEHMGFLALWLSRFVFSSSKNPEVSPSLFPIVIFLARGDKIALAPAVLASIYRDLSLLKRKIVGLVNGSDDQRIVLFAPFHLVQLWAWERFPTLSPKPITLLPGEPRLARWQNVRKLKKKLDMVAFESLVESFLWRPYAFFVENWKFPEFYVDEQRWVLINSEVGEELLSFTRCLRHSELVGLDCIEQYPPQRVGRQFGFDQDVPRYMRRFDDTLKVAWSSYDIPHDGVKLFLSPRFLKGDVTTRYFDWSKRASCLGNTVVSEFKKRKSLRNLSEGERLELSNSISAVVMDFRNPPACSVICIEAAISNAVIGMDSFIEKLRRNREKCMDLISKKMVDSVALVHNQTVPSCNQSINPNVVNEAAYLMDSSILVGISRMDKLIEKVENCRKICMNLSSNSRVDSIAAMQNVSVSSQSTQTAQTVVNDQVENEDLRKVECSMGSENRKKICQFTFDDEKCKESENGNVKLVSGSVDDPVIIVDKKDRGDYNAFRAKDAEIETRVLRLEKIVSWYQAAKLGFKAGY